VNRIVIELFLLALVAIILPARVFAVNYTVLVKSNSFAPNHLIINPDDSVTWVSGETCGPYGTGCDESVGHTVTADDFSFSSGARSDQIFFTRVFDEAGEIYYHCEVHSEPGKDINGFMNGRITVRGEEKAFQINVGLNDAWFNPDTSGQGFFITVFPDIGFVSLAWFTYETEPVVGVEFNLGDAGHRWLTALGPFTDNTSLMEISFASGGIFDSATEIQNIDGGTITLIFDDCNSGSVEYDIPSISRSGVVPIQRVADDNIGICDTLNTE
jgi:plastocyanin